MPSTPAVRTTGVAERRARLAARHRLVPSRRSESVVDVARDLVALHPTDPPTVQLSAAARLPAPTVSAVESTWLGPAQVTPRFRTPLERELVAAP